MRVQTFANENHLLDVMGKKFLPFLLLFVLSLSGAILAQTPLTPDQEKKVDDLFEKANALMEKEKFSEALKYYKDAILILPDDPSLLYNGGLSAFQSKDLNTALDLWAKLKKVDPNDWMVRAKLIQTFQALNKISERDAERAELFELRKSKKNDELSQQDFYCREQFESNGYRIIALEHFELKGDRAIRYAFMVNKLDKTEEFKISLGSYSMTNAVWRETTKPTPKEGERLFHLDGYYKWGHATHGMYPSEPSYEKTREIVIGILEGKSKPLSTSTKGAVSIPSVNTVIL